MKLVVGCFLMAAALTARAEHVTPMMSKDLTGLPGKEASMIVVEYAPGDSTPVHRHNAQVFVYVLEGSVVMQVKGGKEVTLTPGQTFYESPDDIHVVSRNASNTQPAKFLVFFVRDKKEAGQPQSAVPQSAVPQSAVPEGVLLGEAVNRQLLGQRAPAVAVTTIDGETIDLGKLYGKKPVYLKFWATWCVPCRQQMPGFEKLYEKLGDQIQFIAVNVGFNDDEARVRAYRARSGIRLPIVMDDGLLGTLFDLRVTPQHVLIGRDGRIAYVGHLDDRRIDAAVRQVLAQPTSAPSVTGQMTVARQRVFRPGDQVSGLEATTSTGAKVSLDGRHDRRVRAVVFFSTWCESYLSKSQPQTGKDCERVRETVDRLAADRNVEWLGIAGGLWSTPEDLKDYQSATKTKLPIALDATGTWFRSFGVRRIPAIALIDSNGQLLRMLGPDDRDIEGAIRAAGTPSSARNDSP
jgi:quercetin dioxygenase-like cupin family protein/peroxiredoxin